MKNRSSCSLHGQGFGGLIQYRLLFLDLAEGKKNPLIEQLDVLLVLVLNLAMSSSIQISYNKEKLVLCHRKFSMGCLVNIQAGQKVAHSTFFGKLGLFVSA